MKLTNVKMTLCSPSWAARRTWRQSPLSRNEGNLTSQIYESLSHSLLDGLSCPQRRSTAAHSQLEAPDFLLLKLSINKPRVTIANFYLDSVDLKAFKRFRLDRFASGHNWVTVFVAYEKDTSESTEIRVAESRH